MDDPTQSLFSWAYTWAANHLDLIIGLTGLIGLPLAIYLYLLKPKVLCHAVRTFPIVSRVRGLSFIYNGRPVNRVSISRVLLWNSGRAAIRRSDMPDNDRLRLQLTDVENDGGGILGVLTLKATNEKNAFDFTVGEDGAVPAVHIDFSFIQPGEGIGFDVVHNLKEPRLELLGTLLDTKIRNPDLTTPFERLATRLSDRTISRMFGFVVVLIGIASLCAAIFLPEIGFATPLPATTVSPRWLVLGIGILYLIPPVYWFFQPKVPRALSNLF